MFGFLESEELEKRVNRSQPYISSTWAYATIAFQMLEKRTNKGGVEILIADRRRQLLQALMRKLEKESKRVAVAGDRVRTCSALFHQPVRKERLQ